ncbi:MAG TPA: RDD family protein [Candidatus Acidoferrales bacterium]|jgi:uncharacterized RDD family membrane protein YckC|nr:RDD family protein [Candidatus Acidoferrales bacterium]
MTPRAPTEGNLAVEPDWRREVTHRLESYRARRRRLRPNEAQAALPFSRTAEAEDQVALSDASASAHLAATEEETGQVSPMERVEIPVAQPDADLGGAADRPVCSQYRGSARPLLPVAELSERGRAGLFDAGFLLLAYGGFLAMFSSLGGHLTLGKFEAAVYAATLALFYAQYFALFTVLGGSTPGMLLRGLRVVGFDGAAPSPRQMLWRSFGYLVSAGTALLGFLWALWDEDHLTWQDRISQTYLTRAKKPGGEEARVASR